MNIGILITDVINNKNEKEGKMRIMLEIDKIRKKKMKEQEDMLKRHNYYIEKYENNRNKNEDNYKKYLINYIKNKEEWLKSGRESEMEKLKNLKRPEIIEVDDIYTKMIIRNENFKN